MSSSIFSLIDHNDRCGLAQALEGVEPGDPLARQATLYAIEMGGLEVLKMTLALFGRLDPSPKESSLAGACASTGDAERLAFLLDHGADPCAIGLHGWTPALIAARSGHVDCLSMLLERGASPDSRNAKGWTGAMLAAYYGHPSCLLALARFGADLDIKCLDQDAAFLAAARGHLAALQTLAEAGADLSNPHLTSLGFESKIDCFLRAQAERLDLARDHAIGRACASANVRL